MGFGENQKKLDVFADEQFIAALKDGGECCFVASEEQEEGILLTDTGVSKDAKYIVCIDPLDGSSNIDVNVSVGTIFSIYRRISPLGESLTEQDLLQNGLKVILFMDRLLCWSIPQVKALMVSL